MRQPKQSKAAVIGAGAWGTTLANLLADRGWHVGLWAFEEDLAERMRVQQENAVYLPDVPLAGEVSPTPSIQEATRYAELIVWAVPAQFTRNIFSLTAPHLEKSALLVSATKGIENGSLMSIVEMFSTMLSPSKQVRLACLSGPSFAREVSMRKPTAVVAASYAADVARYVQGVFSTPHFRVYTSGDVRGVELGGALKNVIALASGIAEGLDLGSSTRAALITRGLAEMIRLGVRMGAERQTFSGLSSIGDLVLTCSGELSRNRTVGYQIGRGRPLRDILAEMRAIAEGVTTVISMVGLGKRYQVELPIAEKVHAILYDGEAPLEAVAALMSRDLKDEFWDAKTPRAP